jgi:hypothetical protein
LQGSEIETDLNFVSAVVAGNDAHRELVGIMLPVFQDRFEIF